jgi:hypothetical protein
VEETVGSKCQAQEGFPAALRKNGCEALMVEPKKLIIGSQ